MVILESILLVIFFIAIFCGIFYCLFLRSRNDILNSTIKHLKKEVDYWYDAYLKEKKQVGKELYKQLELAKEINKLKKK